MAAQRKLIDPAISHRLAEPVTESEGWAPRPTEGNSTSKSSPAHLLLLELSARLQQPTPVGTTIAIADNQKWPVPARLATIGLLSVASWGIFYLAIAAII